MTYEELYDLKEELVNIEYMLEKQKILIDNLSNEDREIFNDIVVF